MRCNISPTRYLLAVSEAGDSGCSSGVHSVILGYTSTFSHPVLYWAKIYRTITTVYRDPLLNCWLTQCRIEQKSWVNYESVNEHLDVTL